MLFRLVNFVFRRLGTLLVSTLLCSLVLATPVTAQVAPEENGFAVDGMADDWSSIPVAGVDAQGDSICGPETDLIEVRVYVSQDCLYILQTVANAQASAGWYHIHLQYTNDAGYHDQFIEIDSTDCQLLEGNDASVADVDGALGTHVELRVPWQLLGNPAEVVVWPVAPKEGTEPCDELLGFTVERPVANQPTGQWEPLGPQTDLLPFSMALGANDTGGTIVAVAGSVAGEEGTFLKPSEDESWSFTPYAVPMSTKTLHPYVVALSPLYSQDQVMYLTSMAIPLTVGVSHDVGHTWEKTLDGAWDVRDMAFSPTFATDGTLYLADGQRCAVSRDGGYTWADIPAPVHIDDPEPAQHGGISAATSPDGQATMLVGMTVFPDPDYNGEWPPDESIRTWVLVSVDDGASWQEVTPGEIGLVRGWSFEYQKGSVRFSPNFAFDRTVALASPIFGLFLGYLGEDGQVAWTPVASPVYGDAFFSDTFLAFSPHYAADHTLYLGADTVYAAQVAPPSEPDGPFALAGWEALGTGLPDRYIEDLTFSPADGSQLYALISQQGVWRYQFDDSFESCESVTEIAQSECEALVALYTSTNGPAWVNHENWLQSKWPSTWFGVTVVDGHVTELNLPGNGLDGPLPPEIGNLTELTHLGIVFTQLSGPLPTTLNNLTKLRIIDLDMNAITGPLPDLSALVNLDQLVLFGNQMSGPLPEAWGQPLLRYVFLSENEFTGTIPVGLRSLPALRGLHLDNNLLDGQVSGDWNAPMLQTISLGGNRFSALPSAWTGLPSEPSPGLHGNRITALPEPFTWPGHYLNLSDNLIASPLPASMASLALYQIDLSGNRLTGALPAWIPQMEDLFELRLARNAFTGPIPVEYGDLAVWCLDLSDNQLTGEIPWELARIGFEKYGYGQLRHLLLGGNRLTGSLPQELIAELLDPYHFLYNLDVSHNQLSGPIPEDLGRLPDLQWLRLDHNHFSGPIPATLGSGIRIHLRLGQNHLSGSIPVTLGEMVGLEILDLADNALEGPIPPEIVEAGKFAWPYCGSDPMTCWWDLSHNRLDSEGTDLVVGAFVTEHDNDWAMTQWPPLDAGGVDITAYLGGGVAVTYGEVTESGQTNLVTFPEAPAEGPPGFSLQGVYYDITTTSQFNEALGLNVTIPYDDRGMTPEDEQNIALLHYHEGVWTDCTIARDAVANTVTGHVHALSVFVATVGPGTEPPSLDAIAAPLDPVSVGTSVAASAGYSGPAEATAAWDWGDGSVSAGTVEGDTVVGDHTYATPGVYTVQLTVATAGATAETTFQYVVVYNPEGGFVTGGGWITSPEGAYTADLSLTGKATFGFVSKYEKGATLPTGETQFQFRVASLDFHSTSYDWLVVAGAKAKYKGTGMINGEGEYGFMLGAIDGNAKDGDRLDKFRIKIWDKTADSVVYDNQMEAADDADPTTSLGGGSIVVHK